MPLLNEKKDFLVSEALRVLIEAISSAGGIPVAVGGCVRDHLLGKPPKDVDLEVFSLEPRALLAAIRSVGKVNQVGKSFAILKVTIKDHLEQPQTFDIGLPRTESKHGIGHKGFIVSADPNLSFEEASKRRDFSINAMGWNLLTNSLIDPHLGSSDLEKGILRHVSDAFDEDPLRVLRACQFAARMKLSIDKKTIAKCQRLKDELHTLPKERIFEEIQKLLLAEQPSIGLRALHQTKALELFPELIKLIGCPQDKIWHPEGDVWTHTLMVVDEAARIAQRDALTMEETLVTLLGALCHDLGKPETTSEENGHVKSKGHEQAGEAPTRTLLEKMGVRKKVVEQVVTLVLDHLKPWQLYKEKEKVSDSAIRRLAHRVPIELLCRVAEADFLGRTTEAAKSGQDPSVAWLKARAKDQSVAKSAPTPILMGRHLIDLGFKPGRKMGEVLRAAFEAQLDGAFKDLDGAQKWIRSNYNKSLKK